MLELEKLSDQSFDDIVRSAVKNIAHFDTDWNNLQLQDPGMTLVDLFSWLKAMQHEYMSVIVPESQRRFLRLLNIVPQVNFGSRTLIELSDIRQDVEIPAETKWLAGDMVFENPACKFLFVAGLRSVCFCGGNKETVEAARFDGRRIFDIFPGLGKNPASRPNSSCTLNFDRPIPADKIFTLYFDIFTGDTERNPIGDGAFVPMARLAWEVYGTENGELGWHEADVVSDKTHEFLFSGTVELKHSAEMAENGEGYALRARLLEDDYDLPPRMTRLRCNVIELVQQNTLCRCDILEGGKELVLMSDLGLRGEHRVFIPEGETWVEIKEFECQRQPEKGYALLSLSGSHEKVMVLSFDEHVVNRLILGSGTGFSGHTIKFEQKEICYDSFRLMVGRQKDGKVKFQEWEKREDLFSSDKYARHFVLDMENGVITFGDNERGNLPPKGDGNILLMGLKLTKGKNSDIKKGMINRVLSVNPFLSDLNIQQITAASGGTDMESLEDMSRRAMYSLQAGGKVVTEEDYNAAVHSVPGIAVENCRVIMGFNGAGDNRITIVVQGAGRAKIAPHNAYEKNIIRTLDKARLINTKIEVVWPRTVKIVISGRIVTAPYYYNAEELVKEKLKGFIQGLNKSFGTPLSYGELYCAVELLECVSTIESLSVEPISSFITKTRTDDIIVPPNCIYEIERFNLSFISSL